MHCGARDKKGVYISPDARRFITNVHKAFYGVKGYKCLRCALLFLPRIGEHYGFTPAVFGYVLAPDVSTLNTTMCTVTSRSRDKKVRTALKDLWSTAERPEAIRHIICGILDASEMMHCKVVFSQDQLLELGQIL